jgi:hypothetical protein
MSEMKQPACPAFFRSCLLVLLACSSLACSTEEPDPDELLAEVTSCGARELVPCDILDRACQERIAEIAACQWGGPGTPALLPVVTARTEDEYRALLTQASPPASKARAAVDATLALLGLIDKGDLALDAIVNRTVDIVLAYYDFESKAILLIDRGEPGDLAQADATLLHELIHAQQDAAHDLAALQAKGSTSSDAIAATQSLYEGEASFHQWLFEAEQAHAQLNASVVDVNLRRRRVQAEGTVFTGKSVLSSSLQVLPYTYGPVWMMNLWQDGGRASVQERYADAPSDLLNVLQATWGAEQETPELLAYPSVNVYYRGERPAPDSELIPISLDRLGAYGVYVVARLAGDAGAGERLGLGWRGDQLDVYQPLAGGAAGRWQVRFDAETNASAFSELMLRNPNVTVRQRGALVVCVVSESGAEPEWLFGPLGVL